MYTTYFVNIYRINPIPLEIFQSTDYLIDNSIHLLNFVNCFLSFFFLFVIASIRYEILIFYLFYSIVIRLHQNILRLIEFHDI